MNQVENILSQVRTVEEANKLLNEVDLVLDSYFELGEQKKKELFDSKLSYPTSQIFKDIIQQFGADHAKFEEYLKKIKNDTKAMKVLKLTIAFQPDDSTIQIFSNWTRANISKNVLIDININPGILGGAEISFGGHYKDMTLRSKLDLIDFRKLWTDLKTI